MCVSIGLPESRARLWREATWIQVPAHSDACKFEKATNPSGLGILLGKMAVTSRARPNEIDVKH